MDKKDKMRQQRKEYREKNAEKIKQIKKEYNNRPEVKQANKEKNANHYLSNREKVIQRQKARSAERSDFINNVALKYGCQNLDCGWDGELFPEQLDFHHFDPKTKIKEVSKLTSASYDKIIEEINKCVVLCRNCHYLYHVGLVKIDESMKCKEIISQGLK